MLTARRSAALAAGLAAALGGCFVLLVLHLPPIEDSDWAILKQFPPKQLHQLIAQRDVLLEYARDFPVSVAVRFCFLYVFMQTFAIPGTIWLSVLSGAIYGGINGFILVSVINVIGSCSCFAMSFLIGKPLVHAIWPEKIEDYSQEVQRRKAELFNYIVFLRVTPILPNTFINVASPIVGVPIPQFGLGTLVGCMPNNFVFVNAGSRLGELQSLADLYDIKLIFIGCIVGVAALVPIFWKRAHENKAAQLQQAAHKPKVS